MGGWALTTLRKRHLQRFEERFGVQVLQTDPLIRPPVSPAYPLNWAEQLYALRTT
jgi:hypothetical protein